MKKDIEELIEDATRNVTEDRAATKVLLTNLMKYMQGVDDRHREVGLIAAKYVETLQRSNEQLVKIASLRQKGEGQSSGLTDQEREEIFKELNGGE